MPKGGTKRTTKTTTEKELGVIARSVRELTKDVHNVTAKKYWRRSLEEFGIGVMRGVGFVIGTTVVAAALIYALQALVDWAPVESSVQEFIGRVIKSA